MASINSSKLRKSPRRKRLVGVNAPAGALERSAERRQKTLSIQAYSSSAVVCRNGKIRRLPPWAHAEVVGRVEGQHAGARMF